LFGVLRQAVDLFNGDQVTAKATPLGSITGEDFTMMLRVTADSTLLRYLRASGKSPDDVQVLADKTPQHVLHWELLRALYPTCKFINIVRDPRDAATSALFHLAKGDPRPIGEVVGAFIGESWRIHIEAAIAAERRMGSDRFLNVRYEDLHADPDPVIRLCLQHLDVDASDSAVAACREAGSFERMSGGRRRGEVDPGALCRNGLVGDWRNHIPAAVAQAACEQVAALMKHFGYANRDIAVPAKPAVVRREPQISVSIAKGLRRGPNAAVRSPNYKTGSLTVG
jgi:hypothetical protein